MRLDLIGIFFRGVPNKECVGFKANSDTTLNYYVVLNTRYIGANAVSTTPQHVFWFPPRPIRKGDTVLLYTGSGNAQSTVNADGTNTHYYYWGSKTTLWNEPEACAVLLELTAWATTPRGV